MRLHYEKKTRSFDDYTVLLATKYSLKVDGNWLAHSTSELEQRNS